MIKSKLVATMSIICMTALLFTGCGNAGMQVQESNDINNNTEEAMETEETAAEEEMTAQALSFTAKDLDGNIVTESIFSEKDLTVVNVWGTFCSPCIGEMPELGEWAESMPENVQLIGLIIDIAGDEDVEHHNLAVEITKKAEADFLQIVANSDFQEILADIIGVPTTFFVDKNGNIVGESIIGADVEGYKKFVEDYLDEH